MTSLTFEGKLYVGAIALLSIMGFQFFGEVGMRTVVGFALLMILPFYFIFSFLECSELEKIAFSFFTGITIVPSLTYWLGLLVPFRVAILLVFVILVGIGATLYFVVRKKEHAVEHQG